MAVFSKRSIVAAAAMTSAMLVALTGCGSTGASNTNASVSAGSSTITVWADADHTATLKSVAAEFTKKTGVKVKLVQKDMGSIEQDMITQIPAGKGPDVAIGPNDWTGLLATDGVIQPIELGNMKSAYQKVAIDAFNYNGNIYGLPYSVENVALIRNTQLAPNAPSSWDDMATTATAAKTKYPYLLQVGSQGDSYTMYPVQTSFGSFVFGQNSDGSYNAKKLTVGDANGLAFAKWVQTQAKAGNLSTSMTADIALSKFEQGQSPYIITGPWNISAIQKAGIKIAVDPIPSAGGQAAKPFVGVNGFFLSAKSKNKLAATNFLTTYIGSEKVQQALFKSGGVPSALTKAYNAEAQSDSVIQGFKKAGENGVPMPNITQMSSVWQYLNAAEVSIINNQGDSSTLWNNMADSIKSSIAKQS
ncbi:MAG: maltose ABC transporter substrate-binding protein [Bifidobacterium aquikefiri]|uniref:Periplasmic maltose-binding protein n=1 Tax=Bifidobacterium aquikefiri TaxID=1653207 RepID=A0A261G3Y0_9BIFI|nr:maltose ABC transporter substrate-binding protein [Bifidobacterium aquikefiri]OZG65726.1 periplasmic maltose-binding protein [Bifidobacterium aquikefiri]